DAMKNSSDRTLQRAGGISALVSTFSYIVGIGLWATFLTPLGDPDISITDYVGFSISHKALIFIWNFLIYIVHGGSLIILIIALQERLKNTGPHLAKIASGFGFVWTGFILLSGFITLSGNEALIALFKKSPEQAMQFKFIITSITQAIDISDKFLGSIWIGLVSLAALKKRVFPLFAIIIGWAISLPAFSAALVFPINSISGSLIFGMGALVWWLVIGIYMISTPESQVKNTH
ncbi:MAG: hypothetical protein JXN62_12780, partial [Bacteroidales bacterium]|nr:hypothetical protein [Bacteroidales bacterium]